MERTCHLKSSLEGSEATVLWQVTTNISEAEIVKLLMARFDDASMVELPRASLCARRRKRGESSQELHLDICRLVNLAHPKETSHLNKILARDAFLAMLNFELKFWSRVPLRWIKFMRPLADLNLTV
jgi:hypothetical protein